MGADDSSSGLPPPREAHGWQKLLVEPRRPIPIAASPWAPWLVVGTVCIGAFMGQLDSSIVIIALPAIQSYFHSSLGAVEWVSLAYLLMLIAMVIAIGRFADMVGRKLLYLYGFAIFIVSSGLCALAPDLAVLAIFRILQGFGAAMLQAAAQALGLSLGPAVGGLLLVLGGWRLLFVVNIPVGLIAFSLGWFLLPRSRFLAPREPIDWRGLGLFVIAITSLLLALSFGDQAGWTSGYVLASFVVALAAVVAFIALEMHLPAPMVQLSVFRKAEFSAGITSGLLSYLALFGALFIFPFYLQFAGHMSAAAAGARLLSLPLALGLTAPAAGILADRWGARLLTVGGMLLTAVALLAIALHPSSGGLLLLELIAIGAGIGAFTSPNNAAIMGTVRREQSGMASGILNMTRGMGTAIGVALTGVVFGLAAGVSSAQAHLPALATRGLVAAAFFLAAIAVAAAVLSALRGSGELAPGPALVDSAGAG